MFSGFLFFIAGIFMFFDGIAARRDAKIIEEYNLLEDYYSTKKGFHTRVRLISSGVMGVSFLVIGIYFIFNNCPL